MENPGLEKLEKKLGLEYKNKGYLINALTHRSYLNENRNHPYLSNERMEFLGDAVLQFLTSHYLYETYKNEPEGVLTSFRSATVNTYSLSEEAKRLDLGTYLLMSIGEEKTGGRSRPYILANTFEALLGSIFLDFGMEKCKQFLEKELFYKIKSIVKDKKYQDAKSYLQEIVQDREGYTPVYKVVAEEGPDHEKEFTSVVLIKDKEFARGKGSSKQKSEEDAAKNALKLYVEKNN